MSFIGTNISIAAELLKKGEVVAIPTETVYGLAANALKATAVAKVFQFKNRPSFDPLIIHLPSFERVEPYVLDIPDVIKKLADAFCPGPLTLLLKKNELIPDLVTSGSSYVAVRIPAHPVTKALLDMLDFPLAAPSANPFGYISPTTAQHVADQLGNVLPYILDGGPCDIGVESTIAGLNDYGELEILRKGGLPLEEIRRIAGHINVKDNSTSNPKAPGMLESHYAPRVPLLMVDIDQEIAKYNPETTGVISYTKIQPGVPHKHQVILSLSGDFKEAARNLFAGMRYLDSCHIDTILAEFLPEHDLGIAINDRLRRASAKNKP